MKQDSARRVSAQDLSSATGEPIERLRRLRSLKLIGSDGDERVAAGEPSRVRFTPLGKRRLKGLGEELELFEVRSEDGQGGVRIRDPVCGMEMAPTEVGAKLLVRGRELAFCCERCLRVFLTAPERYGAAGEA